jgi:very-short-patch-repair endonuclease
MVYLGKTIEREMFFGAKPRLKKFAVEMRKDPTKAEEKLWRELRKFRSKGFIFRRQHPIDIFIADFYCHQFRLVIEVDGEIHENEDAKAYDDGRSAELERHDIKVLRFRNSEIIENIELVLNTISNSLSEISSPSPLGEGDRRG